MDAAFQKWFHKITNNALQRILVELNQSGSYSNGIDGISINHEPNGGISIFVSWVQLLPNCNEMCRRFSVPKFLHLLEVRKKEYIKLHPAEKEAVESEFEKFRTTLLKNWTSE